MPKPRFRFGLKLVLALMIPLGAIAYWAAPWINDRPIDWVDFSEERLNQALDDGKTVVVFAGADWDATAAVIRKNSFGGKARRWINQKKIVAMSLVGSSTDNHETYVRLNPHRIGGNAYIYASIFSPDARENPIVFNSYFSEDELIAALQKQSKNHSVSTSSKK